MSFFIDNQGALDSSDEELPESPPAENTLVKQLLKEYEEEKGNSSNSIPQSNKKVDKTRSIVDEVIKDMQTGKRKNTSRAVKSTSDTSETTTAKSTADRREIDKLLQKSILADPKFSTLSTLPQYDISDKKSKLQRKKEREKTKGKKWYGLPATELTEDVKRDLEIIQMRSVLDPKHFYKKNDLKTIPKYFQVGKVMDSPLDFYNDRLTKKERKKTLVDELLADLEFKKYNKKKYKEIIEEKQKMHYKAWRNAKRLKKKNK